MKSRRGIAVLLALLAVLCASRLAAAQAADVTPEELRAWQLEGRDFLLIDTRPPNEYGLKRIGNALNMPAFGIASRKLPRARSLVVYDDGLGTREARRAAEELRRAGHRDVQVLAGGIVAWEARGYPGVAPRGVMPIPLVQPVTAARLAQARADGVRFVLVDVRTLEEFLGGHLPAAIHGPPIQLDGALAGVAPEEIVIVYDNGDGEAERQAERVRRRGSRVVRYLFGGVPGWLERGFALER